MENKVIINTPNPNYEFFSSGSTELSYLVASAVHNMTKFYINKLPIGHFKYIHKQNALSIREYKNQSAQFMLKKERPVLGVSYKLNLKDNQLFDSNYFSRTMGTHGRILYREFTRELDTFTDCIIYDKKHDVRLNFSAQYININMEFTHTYDTSMQQMETFWSMKPLFDLDPCQLPFYIKFPIPDNYILCIAQHMGFNIIDSEKGKIVEKPIEFVKELNKFTLYPITYELDTGTGRYRYFTTAETYYLIKFSLPDMDEGERQGNVYQNFHITHSVDIDVIVPSVWYLLFKNENFEPNAELVKEIPPDSIVISDIKYDWLPHVDKNDFSLVGYSGYEFEEDHIDEEIDLRQILFDKTYDTYIEADKKGIKLSTFMNAELYINQEKCTDESKYIYDKDNFKFTIKDGNMMNDYVIALYMDLEVYKQLNYKIYNEESEYLTGRE